jgi:hypothetical protein
VQLQDRRATRPLRAGAGLQRCGQEAGRQPRSRRPLAHRGRHRVAGDENRLTGFTALPVNDNPYQLFGVVEPVVGAIAPALGQYDVVFDTPAGAHPGKFTFRVWVNDVTPPKARLLTRAVRRGSPIRIAISDSGSGVDPRSIVVVVDGSQRRFVFKQGVLRVSSTGLSAGKHLLKFAVSDYQEAKNMENVGPILPNTRFVAARIVVR